MSFSIYATDITLIHPNTPGSTSDVVAREIATAYKEITGNNMIVEAIGGGNQIPGVVAWKNRQRPTVMMTTSTLTVFNPAILKDLPYSDSDFKHVTLISTVTSAWVVRNESSYKTIKDVVTMLPSSKKSFVSYANHSELVNFEVLAEKYNMKPAVTPIKYKGVPEAVAGLLEGSIEVAVLSLNPVLIGQIESGALRVLAHTNTDTMNIGGVSVEPVQKQLGVEQFNGFVAISLPSTINDQEFDQLKTNLMLAINSPNVQDRIKKMNGTLVNKGPKHMNEYIQNFRDKIKNIELK